MDTELYDAGHGVFLGRWAEVGYDALGGGARRVCMHTSNVVYRAGDMSILSLDTEYIFSLVFPLFLLSQSHGTEFSENIV